MTIHVFVGAGPANLHRALKIKKMDPNAQIVIMDKRLRPETQDIDRVRARANIFRFENNVVTQSLLADGVDPDDLAKLTYDRDFSVRQGFQHGDDKVFSANRFTQIQIRDLQLLLLKTLTSNPDFSPPLLLAEEIQGDTFADIEQNVGKMLYAHRDSIQFDSERLDIQIHTATGALHDDEKKDAIIYPDKATHQMFDASADVKAMPVTPMHGTTTFFIKDPETHEQIVSCEQLEQAQRSLDLTDWQNILSGFGWNLIRPPRIRVFYANDVLYIGAEIPASMMSMNKQDYEEALTAYMRTIGSLVFPGIDIENLPVNPHLRSRFPTERGESGNVLTLTSPHHEIAWGEEGTQVANVQVFNHGDSRYLPHYQTGSGFVTAFLQNEVYAQVYQHKTFHDLFDWAKGQGHLQDSSREDQLKNQYKKIVGENSSDAQLLQAFQTELFMALTRDIIDENKAKVGRYFNAIHSQALAALEKNFDTILGRYNHFHLTNLTAEQFIGLDKRIVVMQMLHSNNIGFLRETLPLLLNKDFTAADDLKLMHIRDMHLLDFEQNIPISERVGLEEVDQILTSSIRAQKQKFVHQHFDEVYQVFNPDVLSYTKEQIPQENKTIVFMEMFNQAKVAQYLRRTLPFFVDTNLSESSNQELLELRDGLTQDYMKFVPQEDFDAFATNLTHLIEDNPGSEFSHTDEAFKMAMLVKNQDIDSLMIDLKLPFLEKEQDKQAFRQRLIATCYSKVMESGPLNATHFIYIPHILEMDPAELRSKITEVANEFATNKTLHQRHAISFFKGKHSDTINNFVQELRSLSSLDLSPEELKISVVDIMQRFHDKLEAGHSKRTLHELDKVFEREFPLQLR